jgi:UDP-N-acetyl-2-amino-2-deoxyglucuronate dehydrogenase
MYTISIIGLGFIGLTHLKALKEIPKKFKLLGYYDKEDHKVNLMRYSTFKKLLNDKPDVVVISTPSYTHTKIAEICIFAGIKNIIIEKPISFFNKDLIKLKKISKSRKVKIFSVNQLRFKKNFQNLFKIIKSKKFGDPFFVNMNSLLNRDKNYFKKSTWKGIKRFDGGFLFNQFYHNIDIACWLFGRPTNYKSVMMSIKNKMKDTGSAQLIYNKKKLIINFNFTICVHKKNYEQSIIVLFEKGTLVINNNFTELVLLDGKTKNKKIKIKSKKEDDFVLFYNGIYKKIKMQKLKFDSIEESRRNISLINKLYK